MYKFLSIVSLNHKAASSHLAGSTLCYATLHASHTQWMAEQTGLCVRNLLGRGENKGKVHPRISYEGVDGE
jgi:hypothetical protein